MTARLSRLWSYTRFRQCAQPDARGLKQLYFTGKNAGRLVPKDIAIASATVNKP